MLHIIVSSLFGVTAFAYLAAVLFVVLGHDHKSPAYARSSRR